MDIHFSCSACGLHMVIEEEGAGMVVQCLDCGCDLNVPKATESQPNHSSTPATRSRSSNERTVAMKWTPPPEGGPKK
jgi:uncharacterized Zn finger protein